MKKFLFSLMTLAVMGLTAKVQAQCDLKQVAIVIPTTIPTGFPGAGNPNPFQVGLNCNAYFNVSFLFNNNGGNKTVVIQAWKGDPNLKAPSDPTYMGDYPNYWKCANGTSTENKAPELTGPNAGLRRTAAPYSVGSPGPLPFLNIAFDGETNTVITTNYPGGGVTLQSGYTVNVGPLIVGGVNDGYRLVTLSNLFVIIPNYVCGAGVNIVADVWSSQASLNSGWTPHCVICNQSFAYNYPIVSAEIICSSPRTYRVTVNNANTSQIIDVTWKAYLDAAPFGGTRGIEDNVLVDDQATTPGITPPISINPGVTYNGGLRPWTGSGGAPNGNQSLWIEFTTSVGGVPFDNVTNAYAAKQTQSCIGLPVEFKSFTATRNRSNVIVKWETSTEQNNSGFAVERNINGIWEQVAFVPSQAAAGNSSTVLSYQFNDLNNTKGITQYRIKQIDLDAKSKLSEIRSVRGDGQKGQTIIYPNPTADGKVNIVFEETNVSRDISVSDMTGRTVKQMKGVTANNITIENLTPGMYSLRIIIPGTGEQTVEKIVVNKR